MKKIILLLTFTSLLFSCNNDDNSNSSNNNNNGNSFTNSMDYEFTITINGEVHKVKGNTTDGIPSAGLGGVVHYINNDCKVINYPNVYKAVMLSIDDVTASNYVSGQNLTSIIQLPNLLQGVNQARVNFSGAYFDTLSTALGAYSSGYGLSSFQTVSGASNYSIQDKLPITITDLGTTSTYGVAPYNFGQTLKGNYSGTIYLKRQLKNYDLVYDIPVQLSIDFKALRMY
jgi:hypothetical protein